VDLVKGSGGDSDVSSGVGSCAGFGVASVLLVTALLSDSIYFKPTTCLSSLLRTGRLIAPGMWSSKNSPGLLT
jgi:hypothetical protein